MFSHFYSQFESCDDERRPLGARWESETEKNWEKWVKEAERYEIKRTCAIRAVHDIWFFVINESRTHTHTLKTKSPPCAIHINWLINKGVTCVHLYPYNRDANFANERLVYMHHSKLQNMLYHWCEETFICTLAVPVHTVKWDHYWPDCELVLGAFYRQCWCDSVLCNGFIQLLYVRVFFLCTFPTNICTFIGLSQSNVHVICGWFKYICVDADYSRWCLAKLHWKLAQIENDHSKAKKYTQNTARNGVSNEYSLEFIYIYIHTYIQTPLNSQTRGQTLYKSLKHV